MEAKVVKKGTERNTRVETAVYFESRTQAGVEVYCMFERAANLLITVGKELYRNDNQFETSAESLYLRVDRFVISSNTNIGLVSDERRLYQGKATIDREVFARHYNNVRRLIIEQTIYLEP